MFHLARSLAGGVSQLGVVARLFAGFAFFGRRQIDARAAALGKADGDRLLGRAGAVLTLGMRSISVRLAIDC
jgi:hypothetical protein